MHENSLVLHENAGIWKVVETRSVALQALVSMYGALRGELNLSYNDGRIRPRRKPRHGEGYPSRERDRRTVPLRVERPLPVMMLQMPQACPQIGYPSSLLCRERNTLNRAADVDGNASPSD